MKATEILLEELLVNDNVSPLARSYRLSIENPDAYVPQTSYARDYGRNFEDCELVISNASISPSSVMLDLSAVNLIYS